jgi:hypothetical protein
MRESRAMAAVVEFEKTRGFRVAAGALVLALALIAVTVIVYQRAHQQALTHVRIAGGGFLVYYRLGEIRAGITVLVQKATTSQSRIVATFEDPAGGADIVLERRIRHGLTRYGLETPAVHGVVKDQPYRVRVDLYDYGGTTPLETHETTIRSGVDPARVPDRPLTIGPGYNRAPAPEGQRRQEPASAP